MDDFMGGGIRSMVEGFVDLMGPLKNRPRRQVIRESSCASVS